MSIKTPISTPIDTGRTLLAAALMASVWLPAGAYAPSAFAQTAPVPAAAASTAPSDSAMVNLVRLLVAQKVLTAENGAALIAQAEAEATTTRQAEAAAQLAAKTPATDLPPPADGAVRVAYVPQAVREAIKADLRREVIAQAKAEGWAAAGTAAPDWTRRVAISGDVRIRSQSNLYSATNSDQILNYAAINQSGPYNIAGTVFPYINTREDRVNLLRLRARLNITGHIADGIDAGFQLATGDDTSPISTNATLGGGFGKRSIWLQEAYLRIKPKDWASATLGRMPNPFFTTDELVFDRDLSFDGVSAQVSRQQIFGRNIDVALRGGAFPLDFGDANYLSSQSSKINFPQKYLFSAQAEVDARLNDKLKLQVAGAYHHFSNIQGQLSQPCLTGDGQVDCSTDGLRPFFLQKGNTLSYLRLLATSNGAPLTALPQYFGLTFNYHLVNLNALLSYELGHDRALEVSGDFVRNVGLKRADICRNGVFGEPFNNGGSEGGSASICDPAAPVHDHWSGGRDGYQATVRLGDRQPLTWGQWQVEAAYRRIGTDAVLDSFTDSDFHLGGTNAKGYILGAKAGIFNNMSLGARWLSSNSITSQPLAIDVLQVDLNARF